MRPSSATRPRGHQPPQVMPRAQATSSAARSTPVSPPETTISTIARGVESFVPGSRFPALVALRPQLASRAGAAAVAPGVALVAAAAVAAMRVLEDELHELVAAELLRHAPGRRL